MHSVEFLCEGFHTELDFLNPYIPQIIDPKKHEGNTEKENTSSLNEISIGPAGKKGGDKGWGAQGADHLPPSSTCSEYS